MKCQSCDVILSDFEATRKSATTNQYLDLCNKCFKSVAEFIPVIERPDLSHEDNSFDEEEYL